MIVRHEVKVELAEGDEFSLLHFEVVRVRVRSGELYHLTGRNLKIVDFELDERLYSIVASLLYSNRCFALQLSSP